MKLSSYSDTWPIPTYYKSVTMTKPKNLKESFNNVVWACISKIVFVTKKKAVEFKVYEPVSMFSDGNTTQCKILHQVRLTIRLSYVVAFPKKWTTELKQL